MSKKDSLSFHQVPQSVSHKSHSLKDDSSKKRAALIHSHDMKYHREREEMNRISQVEGNENFPNLGLLSIGALFPPHWEVVYIDEDYLAQNNLPRSYLQEDFDLVCLTAMNHQAYQAYRIADHFRKRGIYTVMGGFHASALPFEALEHVDTVIKGEGERSFSTFLQDWEKGSLKRIYENDSPVDLRVLPPPLYSAVSNLAWYNKFPLFATRGCPRSCDFCCLGKLYGKSYRKKTPKQIAKEIEELKQYVDNPFISFADENMFADKEWGKSLAEELIPLNIKWEAYCDVSIAQDDLLLQLLYQSGCVELIIGFETLDKRNLESADLWKAKQRDKYGEYIRKIQSHNIGILACFVVGFDHDNKDTFENLLSFLLENPVFELDIAVLTPMPGTALYKRLKAERRLFNEKWDDYTWYHVNFAPKNLTPQEIHQGVQYVFKEYSKHEVLKIRREMFLEIEKRFPDLEGRNV